MDNEIRYLDQYPESEREKDIRKCRTCIWFKGQEYAEVWEQQTYHVKKYHPYKNDERVDNMPVVV